MSERKDRATDRPLFILQYLCENTDDDHKVSLTDLVTICNETGHGGNRHNIVNDINLLINYGFDIVCTKEGCHNCYSYGYREFDIAELRLLIDAIDSSVLIPMEKSERLIQRLVKLSGKHESELLCSTRCESKRIKTDNNLVFHIVDKVLRAIKAGKKIRFQYTEYNGNREKVLHRGGQTFSLSPYKMIWNNDRYYLIGCSDHNGKLQTFRIDRMTIPTITDEAIIPQSDDVDFRVCYMTMTKLYGDGPEMEVKLYCDNRLMNCLVDRFGDDFPMEKVDDGHFSADIRIIANNTFWGWIFENCAGMRIVEPPEAITMYQERLKQALGA